MIDDPPAKLAGGNGSFGRGQMSKSALGIQRSAISNLKSGWSTFWAMVRKELILIARYPVNFVASFGQIFLIVAIFTLGSKTFTVNQDNPGVGAQGPTGTP